MNVCGLGALGFVARHRPGKTGRQDLVRRKVERTDHRFDMSIAPAGRFNGYSAIPGNSPFGMWNPSYTSSSTTAWGTARGFELIKLKGLTKA